MVDNFPVPLNGHIQHHPVFQGIVTLGQQGQLIQLRAFQFGHKAHRANVHTQNGHTPAGGSLGHVQNSPVTAEANHQLCIPQLPVQPGKSQIPGQIVGAVHLKGQTQLCGNACIFQNLQGCTDSLKIFIPVGIGRKDYIFHSLAPLSSV